MLVCVHVYSPFIQEYRCFALSYVWIRDNAYGHASAHVVHVICQQRI